MNTMKISESVNHTAISNSLGSHRLCPPGSSVHGILQATILEWVAIPISRDSPNQLIEFKSPTLGADSLPSEPPEKPFHFYFQSVPTPERLCRRINH